MRIAYLINQYPKTSHTFVRREMDGLEAHGIDVVRFTVRRSSDPIVDPADLRELQRTFVLLDHPWALCIQLLRHLLRKPRQLYFALRQAVQFGRKSERGMFAHAVYLGEACLLASQLEQQNIRHVHAHFGTNSTTVAMLAAQLLSGTFSFTVHGPEEFDHPEAIGLPLKLQHAKFVVAISEFGRSQLYRWAGIEDWDKIHVVRCVIGNEFRDVPSTPVPDTNNLVCVGRLCEQKGQFVLVQAIAELVQQGWTPKLKLVGDGELRAPLEALISKLGIEEHVEILGWKSGEEVVQQILDCRAFVLPSFAEGLPVAIMEAFAAFRPVVSTYVAGIPELVRPGRNGWLVPAGSLSDLIAALRTVLDCDLHQLSAMGAAGAADVRYAHCQATEAGKLAAVFRTYAGEEALEPRTTPAARPLVATSSHGF